MENSHQTQLIKEHLDSLSITGIEDAVSEIRHAYASCSNVYGKRIEMGICFPVKGSLEASYYIEIRGSHNLGRLILCKNSKDVSKIYRDLVLYNYIEYKGFEYHLDSLEDGGFISVQKDGSEINKIQFIEKEHIFDDGWHVQGCDSDHFTLFDAIKCQSKHNKK